MASLSKSMNRRRNNHSIKGSSSHSRPQSRQFSRSTQFNENDDDDSQRALRRMQAFDQDSDEEETSSNSPEYDEEVDQQEANLGSSSAEEEAGRLEDEDSSDQDSNEEPSDDYSNDSDMLSDEDEGEDEEERLARIKRELAEVPFDQLIEIQQKVGMKKFHANYRANRKVTVEGSGEEDSEEESGLSREAPKKETRDSKNEKKRAEERKKPQKRANKNMPVEVTSKRPVTRRREIMELPKKKTRDPRFDPLAGKLNEGLFEQSYGFIHEYEKDEIEMLKKQIVKEKDPERKEKLKKTLTSMQSRMQTRKQKEKRKELVRNWRKSEQELVKQGKKPWSLKKSDIKKLELVEKYQAMKPKDVDKLLEKRRKKNAAKEKRFMPYKRRSG